MQKPVFSIGRIPPTPEAVNQFFNGSTDVGDFGEKDEIGPWNSGGEWEMVEAPAFKDFKSELAGSRGSAAESSQGDSSQKTKRRKVKRRPRKP